MSTPAWTDLLDPTEGEVRARWPEDLHGSALEVLMAPAAEVSSRRPRLESHGDYVIGVLLVPVVHTGEDRLFYEEVDLLLTREHVLTVRKTPMDDRPFDLADVHDSCRPGTPVGMVAYLIVDKVAEGFLDLIDALQEEIDELEDHIDEWTNAQVRQRMTTLRRDMLQIRRTLSPTRDAVRRVVDNRVELDGDEQLFPHDVELRFADAYDKLLRCTEGLDTARDLIAGMRDYHQAKVANDQNEIMKALTIVAAIFLPPTFIVGVYGQNFDHMPELHWLLGYLFSWVVIVAVTVVQLMYFRRKGWIGAEARRARRESFRPSIQVDR